MRSKVSEISRQMSNKGFFGLEPDVRAVNGTGQALEKKSKPLTGVVTNPTTLGETRTVLH